MKATLVFLVALGAVTLAEGYRTTTQMPCPDDCPPSPRFVCARDRRGNVYRFTNSCYMQKCGCKMWLQQVPMSECPRNAPGCPLRTASDESVSDESANDESSASDEQQQQQQQQQWQGNQGDEQTAAADSLEQAHLERNNLRKKARSETDYRY